MTRTDCKSDQMHKEVISTIWSDGKFCPPWETLISQWSRWSDPTITWRPAGQGIRSPRWLHLACFHTPRSWCYETGRNSCDSGMTVITLPAICIFWRSGGAGYPGWEVARLLVLVLRLLKTLSSYFHNHEGSRPKKGLSSVMLKQIKVIMGRTHLWRNSGEAGPSSTPPAKTISIWTTRQQWAH